MAEGNRKDPRARVLNMTVRYKSATVDEFIENHSHDISRGGIFIKTRSPFPAGTLLKFEVRIAEDQKLMHGVGRVVWRREADRAEESFPAGMGIKFIKTGEGAAELINQLILAREGAESSFDAGVREAVSTPSARPSVVPPAAAVAAQASSAAPTSGPALSVESGPRSLPADGGTAVTNPAKKRQDLSPEKRKVVLQGPALESPPSNPKPLITPAARGDERAPSRERPARGSIAEETTSPRARTASVKKEKDDQSPKLSGLLVILGLIALIVFVVNRLRGSAAEPELEPTPTVAAEPAPQQPLPVPAAPVEAAQPEEPTAAPVDPTAPVDPSAPAAAELGAGADPGAAGTGAAAAAADPSAAEPSAADPTAAGGTSPAATPPASAAPTAPAPSPAPPATTPPAATAPAPAPAPAPTPAPAPKAVAPAPAKPPPPKPAPTPPRAAPKPQPTPPPAAPPADSAEPAPAPTPPPPPPTTGTAGESSGATPPAKKPPAPSAEPAPPAPPAPPPAAPTPSDDNPY